jgi:Xaa-Pro aminopeptidase
MITAAESQQRITKLQGMLNEKGIDGALFIFPIDVYYFSGTRQNSTLWIPATGDAMLLVRKSFTRAKEESPLKDIRPFPSSKEFAGLFPEDVQKIGFTFDVAPAQQLNFYAKLLPGRELVDISAINREIRSVKSPFELEQLRFCGEQLCSIFAQVPTFLQAGMRELDLAAEFEYRLRKAGNEGYVRMRAFNQELFGGLTVAAGGVSYGFFDGAVTGRGLSSASPQGASLELIRENEPVFVDFTGVFNGYITDMTRIFVIGTLDPELKRAFDVSIEIQNTLQSLLKPGAVCEELFLKSAEMAAAAGLGEYYMGMPGENARFVGHGVGLELDEFPVLAQGFKVPLVAGNVIAIEPKFVIPGKGVIGIENTFLVTGQGGERVTDISDGIMYI